MEKRFRQFDVMRVRAGRRIEDVDRAATEEPLEIRLHGQPFAVIMRTPGQDRELAAGFLLAEQVIRNADDLGTIERCAEVERHAENIVNVTLANGSADALDRVLSERRQVATNSSCGLCGRLTIESLRTAAPRIESRWRVERSAVIGMPDRLRAAQAVFDETGGLHAAGLFGPGGELQRLAEDVGRHNAVDKVIGRLLMADALPLDAHALFVSGRTSFEIVQKALFAGIPVVGSVSAPSSLAIDLARESGITLVGFVRGDSFNIYAHGERIT